MRMLLMVGVVAVGLVPQVPGLAQEPVAPKVRLTFEAEGLVTLLANNATAREILAEWSRQGGSTFVNAERLPGAPLTLQFDHQPEKDVIASILRQASGFVLGPRRAGTVGASRFEVVYILPTSNPSAGGYIPPPSMPSQPQISTPGAPDDELAPIQVGRGLQGPQQQPQSPASDPAPRPTAPGMSGVAVPVVPIIPVTAAPPTTTGRGGRGGGGS